MTKLDEIIQAMNKKAKSAVVTTGLPQYSRDRIPFTSPRMNYCTYGGVPKGKITEFFGEEHGGKTTSALDIIANYQQSDDPRKVLYVDAENTLDETWARKLGVDVDKLILFSPEYESAEDIFQFILDCIDSDEIGLWVLDSIGALASAKELENSMEEKTYAGISSPLTIFGRKAEMLMKKHNCTGIAINQIRDDFNAMYGGAVRTVGGKAWKHYCSVRLQFSRGKFIDESGDDMKNSAEAPAGNYVLMSMIKNKTCPPNRRTGFYTVNYEFGIDYLKDLVEVAIKYDLIVKSGAWFAIINPQTGEQVAKVQGQARVYEFLGDQKNEAVLTAIEQDIDSKIYL